jgi:peptide chain release factor
VIRKEKWDELKARMKKLDILEDDLIEKFILGSGSGGQKVNKTNSCVYLKHKKSGIEIKCQKERGRDSNRYFARKDLCERIEALIAGEMSVKKQEAEKIRRQKRRRSRKAKQKMLEEKKKRSEIKHLRGRINDEG